MCQMVFLLLLGAQAVAVLLWVEMFVCGLVMLRFDVLYIFLLQCVQQYDLASYIQ